TLSCWSVEQNTQIKVWADSIDAMIAKKEHMQSSLESIIEPYLNIQNMISYCRTNTIVEQVKVASPPIEQEDYSDKILLHLVGDVFGEGTGLEGLSGLEHLSIRHRILENLQAKLSKNIFIAS